MPYAARDSRGRIASLHRAPTEFAAEFVDAASDEVLAFLGLPSATDGFEWLDAGFVRVLEDLVWLLVDKGIVRIGELPMPAQAKLLARNQQRLRVAAGGPPGLPADSGFVEVIDDSAFGALPPLTDRGG